MRTSGESRIEASARGSSDRASATIFRDLESGYPPSDELATLLRSPNEAIVHAAVLHLERRIREGDRIDTWQRLLPSDLFALPGESQLVLAALSVDGYSLEVSDPPEALPPAVRLAWVRAALLDRPDALRHVERTSLGHEAISGLPCERVIATGLLGYIVESTDANVRESSIAYLREGLKRGFLPRTKAHDFAVQLAQDPIAPIAIEALRFLREPWTFALPLPRLRGEPRDQDVQREIVQLLGARRDIHQLRRWLSEDGLAEEAPALASDLMTAIGDAGDASDIPSMIGHMRKDPYSFGAIGLEALVALKRRGSSPDDDEARSLLELFLDGPILDAGTAAEVLSSRADVVLDAIEPSLADNPEWSRIVSLLEAFLTRRSIQRLRSIVQRSEERTGWWYAIRALGRLGVTDAEPEILTRLVDEPDASLYALRYIGGEQAIDALSNHVFEENASPPVWLGAATNLLFQLEPSRRLLDHLAERGLLTTETLDSLPAHGSLAQGESMRVIVTQHGHPLRNAAIRALGLTGGPLAVDLLGQVVADPDDLVRDETLSALRVLGPRLQKQGALRPLSLESSSDPAGALVADTILRRLRDRSLEPDVLARLLDSLIGLGHPHLVPVIRPYLRYRVPEVRKRVIACLAAAGPAAAAWILPWLSDEDVTVARQALHALTQIRAPGFAEPIARWLDGRNMNMKKTAAEALSSMGDRTVVPKLLHWMATHDNPGFRQLLVSALKAILGPWFVSAIVDRLVTEANPRAQNLLIEGLGGELSASDVAALIRLRGPATVGEGGDWANLLLRRIDAGECALSGGSVTNLDIELDHRELGDLIAQDTLGAEGADAWRAPALRTGVRLRQALRERPPEAPVISEFAALLAKANVRGQMIVPALSRSDVHALIDVYLDLGAEGQAGARQILATATLDPVARLRAARLLGETSSSETVPSTLMRCSADTMSVGLAMQLVDWPDREVRAAAERALVLADKIDVERRPGRDAALVLTYLVRKGSFDACFEWCRQKGHLAELVRTMHQRRGAAFALAKIRSWVAVNPDLLGEMLPEVLKMGSAADNELERFARSRAIQLRLREQIVNELGRRTTGVSRRALFRELLGDEHVALREYAARELLRTADRADRREILAAFLRGAFREDFSIHLDHGDLPFLEHAIHSTAGSARLPLARLLGNLQDPQQVALYVALWKTGDHELKAKCRDALRAIDPHRVLPFLQPDLHDGNESILDVLGPLRSVPESLVAQFDGASDRATWERFLERMSGDGALHAPGLSDVLARSLRQKQADRVAIRLFVRLDEWARAAKVENLAAAIEPALAGNDRDELLRSIVEATAQIGIALRVRVLTSIGRPTDEPVVMALQDAVLENPLVRDTLPAPMIAAIERRMRRELDGDPERARRILSYRATRAKTDTDRAELVDVLERSLIHPSSRVRLHAHRLLRTHAERSRYLSATRLLLRDPDPTTIRSAIRVLAFGRDVEAASEIADLFFHSHPSVRSAAREGLVHLGEDAVPTLSRTIGRARPDRRRALTELLDEIQRGRSEEDDEQADSHESEEVGLEEQERE